jgi:hypothetical protein
MACAIRAYKRDNAHTSFVCAIRHASTRVHALSEAILYARIVYNFMLFIIENVSNGTGTACVLSAP